MTVTTVEKDLEACTMTITTVFDAPVERVWQIWSDPRQLERWWGPPTYPATVVDHDLTPGGTVSYFMTGPEGDKHGGWWSVVAVAAPHRLEFDDGFGDTAGHANPDLPVMRIRVELSDAPDGTTQMRLETTFPSAQAMEQVLAMGMDEGMTAALGQIDPLLAA